MTESSKTDARDAQRRNAPRAVPRPVGIRAFWKSLGPGIVTGAADDDPSGIATYSIAGAQYGTSLLWTALFTWPLMIAVQTMCARIGMVTGQGIAGALRNKFPRPVLFVAAVGLGPFAGVIGIALHTWGSAAKFFADHLETAIPVGRQLQRKFRLRPNSSTDVAIFRSVSRRSGQRCGFDFHFGAKRNRRQVPAFHDRGSQSQRRAKGQNDEEYGLHKL